MQNQITPGNTWRMCTEIVFMHRLCFLPLSQNALLPAHRRYLPSGDTCPYHVHFLGESIRSLSTRSPLPSFLAAFLLRSWLRLISAGWHRSPSALLSHLPCTHTVLVFGCVHRATMPTQIKGCSSQWWFRMCAYGEQAKINWGKGGNENETMR